MPLLIRNPASLPGKKERNKLDKNRKKIFAGVVVAGIFLAITSVFIYRIAVDISTPFPPFPQTGEEQQTIERKPLVYFGVISRYPPNIIYQGYQPIMDYLSQNTPYHFALRLSSSYDETVRQLTEGKVAAAFLGSYIYVKARAQFGIHCLLKPLNENFEPFFRSVLIVRRTSPIRSIEDLKGKRLALPSEQSFSGNWLIGSELRKHGLRVTDLDSVHHFPHHNTVVYQVLKGNFDAGVVKDRVAKEYLTRGIKIIAYSDPIPGSPIVVPPEYNPTVTGSIRQALLKIDVRSEKYRKIIKSWDREFAYGFMPAQDSDYDLVRVILKSSKGK